MKFSEKAVQDTTTIQIYTEFVSIYIKIIYNATELFCNSVK